MIDELTESLETQLHLEVDEFALLVNRHKEVKHSLCLIAEHQCPAIDMKALLDTNQQYLSVLAFNENCMIEKLIRKNLSQSIRSGLTTFEALHHTLMAYELIMELVSSWYIESSV